MQVLWFRGVVLLWSSALIKTWVYYFALTFFAPLSPFTSNS